MVSSKPHSSQIISSHEASFFLAFKVTIGHIMTNEEREVFTCILVIQIFWTHRRTTPKRPYVRNKLSGYWPFHKPTCTNNNLRTIWKSQLHIEGNIKLTRSWEIINALKSNVDLIRNLIENLFSPFVNVSLKIFIV